MNRFSTIFFLLLLTPVFLLSQVKEFPKLTGPYLGQTPPGKIPVKFPFDYMPEGYRLHSAPVFTPDGKEVYFSAMDFSIQYSERIFIMKMIDSIWTPSQVAPFSGNFFDGSPSEIFFLIRPTYIQSNFHRMKKTPLKNWEMP